MNIIEELIKLQAEMDEKQYKYFGMKTSDKYTNADFYGRGRAYGECAEKLQELIDRVKANEV